MMVISGSNSSTLNDMKHKLVPLFSKSSQFIQQLGMRSNRVFLIGPAESQDTHIICWLVDLISQHRHVSSL